MTSREHARRLMLILLSSEGAPGAEAPETPRTERDEAADRSDDCADADRPRTLGAVLVST